MPTATAMRDRILIPRRAWRIVSCETGASWPADDVAMFSQTDPGEDVLSVTCEAAVELGERVRVDCNGVSFFIGTVVNLDMEGEVGLDGWLQISTQQTVTFGPLRLPVMGGAGN